MGLLERLLNQTGGERPYKELKSVGRTRGATKGAREKERGERRKREGKWIRVERGGEEGLDGRDRR